MSYREQYGNGNGFANAQISGMGMGKTLREWEGLGIHVLKTIPAHLNNRVLCILTEVLINEYRIVSYRMSNSDLPAGRGGSEESTSTGDQEAQKNRTTRTSAAATLTAVRQPAARYCIRAPPPRFHGDNITPLTETSRINQRWATIIDHRHTALLVATTTTTHASQWFNCPATGGDP